MNRLWVAMTFLVAGVGLAGCAPAGSPEVPAQPAASPPPAQALPAAASKPAPLPADTGGEPAPGVRVYLDPVTGEAREPTRAEAAAAGAGRVQREAAAGQAASEGAQRERVVLPDGTEGVKLAPRDRHSVVVCRQADGSFGEKCPPALPGPMP